MMMQHQMPHMYYPQGYMPFKHRPPQMAGQTTDQPAGQPAEQTPGQAADQMGGVKQEGQPGSYIQQFGLYRIPPNRMVKGQFYPVPMMSPLLKQAPPSAGEGAEQVKAEPPAADAAAPGDSAVQQPPGQFHPMPPQLMLQYHQPPVGQPGAGGGAPMMMPMMPMPQMVGAQRPFYMFPGQRLIGNVINGIPALRHASSQFDSVAAVLDAVANQPPSTNKRHVSRSRQRARHNHDSGDEDYEGPLGHVFESDRDNNSDEEFKAPGGAHEPRDGVRRSSRTRVRTQKYSAYAESDEDNESPPEDEGTDEDRGSQAWAKVRARSRPGVRSREGRMTRMNRLTGSVSHSDSSLSLSLDQTPSDQPQANPPDAARSVSLRKRAARVNYAELDTELDEALAESDEGEGSSAAQTERESVGGVDRVLDHRTNPDTGQEEYLIKWQGFAHIHNTWDTYEALREYNGIKRVDNYIKRCRQLEERKSYMSPDEIEQENISAELQRQIDEDALVAERVVAHWCELPDGTALPPAACAAHGASKGGDSAEGVTRVYVVKWRSCQYDQCTEEEEETLERHGFGGLVEAYYEREDRISGASALKTPWNTHSISLTKFEPYMDTPTYLAHHESRKLRDYQLTGLNWMVNRMKRGLSVLLADEMGLGKTIQTISLVGHFMYREHFIGPYLIIVPQSTVDNWMRELESWLPRANSVCYYGNAASREIIRQREMCRVFVRGRGHRYKCDICVTTPSIINAPQDLEFLRRISWQLMVVDEAHQLKNRQSKRFIELMQFMADYKLLLSGTPLHNNLEELWTLLHFLNPSIYAYYEDFRRRYSDVENTSAIGESKQRQLLALQTELHEVVLRRVKKDVEKSLPNKVERILRVELSPTQVEWYKNILTRNYDQLSKSSGGSKSSLQNICMELKKVCNHPFLCHEPDDKTLWRQGLVYGSGKICLLEKLLSRLKERGHRVLIFSQMVRMLNILSDYLTLRGYKHQRLDGTMGKEVRKKAMDHFNDPGSDDFCFLLSTKAGGLGINLTTADTVIIYDSDWNPQNDLQAEARAHRIGQTKTVQIYRLVTKDSVEQTILERAKAKMVLDTLVVQGLNKKDDSLLIHDKEMHSGFTRDELAKILKFGASKLWTGDYSETLSKGLDIDLDKVLEEAETNEDTGAAADLLSSYTNITEFRYEPPAEAQKVSRGRKKAGEVSADKDFWDATIPLEERVKLKKQQEEMIVLGPRRTRHRDRGELAAVADFSADDEDDDFSGDDLVVSRKRFIASKRKKGVSKKKGTSDLFDRDKVKLYRAIMKFGDPSLRLDDIRRDAKLIRVNANVVAQECQSIVASARRALEVSTGESRALRRKRASGTAAECLVQVGDAKMSASDIVERLDVLDSLRRWGSDNFGPSWPTSQAVALPPPVAELIEDKEGWSPAADINLLKGIYLYGFGNWTQICSDKKLGLDFAKTSKTDRAKSRAIRLLKLLHLHRTGQLHADTQPITSDPEPSDQSDFEPQATSPDSLDTPGSPMDTSPTHAPLAEVVRKIFSGDARKTLASLYHKCCRDERATSKDVVQIMKTGVPMLGDIIEDAVERLGGQYPGLLDACWKYVSKFTPASSGDLQRVYQQFCKNNIKQSSL